MSVKGCDGGQGVPAHKGGSTPPGHISRRNTGKYRREDGSERKTVPKWFSLGAKNIIQTDMKTTAKTAIVIMAAWIILVAICIASPVAAITEQDAAIAIMNDGQQLPPDDYFTTGQTRQEGTPVEWSCEFVNDIIRVKYFSGNNYLHIKEYPLAYSHVLYERNVLKRYLYTLPETPERYKTWINPNESVTGLKNTWIDDNGNKHVTTIPLP